MNRILRYAGVAAVAAALGGCAAAGNDPRDPFEGFNRAMFTFNDNLDRYALKPTAQVYSDVVPNPVQTGVYNFFGNIGDVWTAANNLLQGKVEDGVTDIMRVAINTTFGLLGVLDIGSELGMPRHRQDFGATLGTWGLASGPYVVLPFLGSSTVRDTAALPVDFKGDLWLYTTPIKYRNTGSLVRVVDQRAGVLNASSLLEDAALDRYEFIRDAYLQRRANKIGGGKSGDKDDGSSPGSDGAPEKPPVSGKPAAAGQEPSAAGPVQLTGAQKEATRENPSPVPASAGQQEKGQGGKDALRKDAQSAS